MNRRQSLAAAASLGLGPWAGAGARAAPVEPGAPVPWPDVPLLGGGRFDAAQASGHAVVAVFWTVTCPFCRRHNQHVEKLHRAAEGRPLRVLGIAREHDPAVVTRYAKAQGYTFPITIAHAEMAEVLSRRRMVPLTVVAGRDGRLRHVIPGEMFEEDVMELLRLAT